MRDSNQRTIDYLRISVTDRCNLRCQYCMPPEGLEWLPREHMLGFDEILSLVQRVFVPLGVSKIRLTGGEPLIRPRLADLARGLKAIPEIRDLSLTTNGLFLGDQALALREAGVDRLNISIDSLDPQRFCTISRGGDLAKVLRGLEAAIAAGFDPIKLNAVILPGVNEDAILPLAHLTVDRPLHVRFIEFMPVGDRRLFQTTQFFTVDQMREVLAAEVDLEPVSGPRGNGPAHYWRIPGALGTVGFINPMSRHFCDTCNRIRLTSDGRVKACLLRESELSLRDLLRQGASDEVLQEHVLRSLSLKPEWHEMGTAAQPLTMSQIGG